MSPFWIGVCMGAGLMVTLLVLGVGLGVLISGNHPRRKP